MENTGLLNASVVENMALLVKSFVGKSGGIDCIGCREKVLLALSVVGKVALLALSVMDKRRCWLYRLWTRLRCWLYRCCCKMTLLAVSEQAAPVTNNTNAAAKQEEPFSRVPPCVYVFVYRLDRSVPAENPLVTLVGPGSLFNDDPFTGVVPPSEAAH